MKYLISFDTNIVRQELAPDWGINKVLTEGSDITSDLSHLPPCSESLVFFIPVTSNYNNSLSYDGANLGLRILMYYLRNNRTDIDIVLMGNESQENFLLHYDYPNILKIPGVSYIRFNKNIVANYSAPSREQLKSKEYIPFLNNLGLKFPSSFKSTHSVTNEWCLYKWSSYMGYDVDTSSLDGILYFDFLRTIDSLNPIIDTKTPDSIKKDIAELPASRILLIDDKMGWHNFFSSLFDDSKIRLHCLGDDFNKRSLDDIKRLVDEEIRTFCPDVIILDFRLMEDADSEPKDNMNKISGYQVLSDVVKGKYNKPQESFGRQVLMFTATKRIENILMLREKGNADGFIFKENPEKYNGKDKVGNILKKLVKDIKVSIKRATFLIPLNENLNNLTNLMALAKNQNKKIVERTTMTAQIVRQLTQKNELNKENIDILKMVYLNLMYILESLKDRSEQKLFNFILNENKAIYNNLDNKVKGQWNNLCNIRNYIAHGKLNESNSEIEKIVTDEEKMKDWTKNLSKFILEFLTLYLKK